MKLSKLFIPAALIVFLAACGKTGDSSNSSNSSNSIGSTSPSISLGESTGVSLVTTPSISSGLISDSVITTPPVSSNGSTSGTVISTPSTDSNGTTTSSSNSSGVVENNISTQALNSIKESFKMIGGYTLFDSDGFDYVHPQTTVFSGDEFYVVESYDGKELGKIHVIKEGSYIYLLSVDKDNNLIKTDISANYNWELFANPFLDLVETDFVETTDGVFKINNASANILANSLSGYTEMVDSVELTVVGNLVTEIDFSALSDDGLSIYHYDISNHGVAQGPVMPYETVSEHAALFNALQALNGNYTIEHFDQSVGFDDISYTYYMTEDAVFKDAKEFDEQLGFFKYKNETYEFEVKDDVAILGDISLYDLFAELPDFSFAAELFSYQGENVYKTHDAAIAMMIGELIGEDYDAKSAASYAHTLSIELKDDELYQIRYSYNLYGQLISDITMTFSDIGLTVLPIDLAAMKHEIDDSTPIEGDYSHMYGTYVGTFNGSELTLVISETAITFNGESALFIEFDEEWSELIVELNGKTFYLGYSESYGPVPVIVVSDGAKYGQLFKQEGGTVDPEIELPTDLEGEWIVETIEGPLTITIEGNTILFMGLPTVVVAYDEYEGLELTFNGVTYYIFYQGEWGPYPEEFTLRDENYALIGEGVRQGGGTIDPEIELPSDLEGEWVVDSGDDEIIIIIEGNTILFNGLPVTVVAYDEYEGLEFTVDGVTYYIFYQGEWGPYPEEFTLRDENFALIGEGVRQGGGTIDPEIELPTDLEGEWVIDSGDDEIIIIIEGNTILFNGLPVTVVAYDEYEGLEFTVDGVTYYIFYQGEWGPYPEEFTLRDGNFALIGEGVRQGGGTIDPEIELPSDLEGEWIVETIEGPLTITIEGNTILFMGLPTVVVAYDEYEGLELTFNGVTYFIFYQGAFGDWPEEFMLRDENFALIGEGVRQGGDIIPSYMEGIWIINLEAGGTVRIDIKGNVIVFDGITATVIEFNPYLGLFIDVDGTTYCIYHYVDYDMVDLYDENDSRIGTCSGPAVIITSEFIGTFEGTMVGYRDGFEEYDFTIVITETSITINEVSVTQIAATEDGMGGVAYEFMFEGEKYTLSRWGVIIYLSNNAGDIYCNELARL